MAQRANYARCNVCKRPKMLVNGVCHSCQPNVKAQQSASTSQTGAEQGK